MRCAEISKSQNIPYKFLERILSDLKKEGMLGSKKGKGGGYYLLQQPKEIEMTKVIRLLEGPIAQLHCVSLNFYKTCDDCPDEQTCSVHKLMIKVRDSSLVIFKNTTLYDLIL